MAPQARSLSHTYAMIFLVFLVGLLAGSSKASTAVASAKVDDSNTAVADATCKAERPDDIVTELMERSRPVDFAKSATIEGEETQMVTIELEPGQSIRTRPGSMIYRTDSVKMRTHIPSGVFKRFLSGTPLFMIDYVNADMLSKKKKATIALGSTRPHKILSIDLDAHGGNITTRKGVFFAGNRDVLIDVKRSSKSKVAQFFGGQGLLMQTLRGRGRVLLRLGGVQIEKDLEKGETLRIRDSSFVACTSSVDYSVTRSTSFKNVMFGDESLFVSTLTGPGKVWLQGMDPRFFVQRTEVRTHKSSRSSSNNSRGSSRQRSSSSRNRR